MVNQSLFQSLLLVCVVAFLVAAVHMLIAYLLGGVVKLQLSTGIGWVYI